MASDGSETPRARDVGVYTDRVIAPIAERRQWRKGPVLGFLLVQDNEESGAPVPSDGDYANRSWPEVTQRGVNKKTV